MASAAPVPSPSRNAKRQDRRLPDPLQQGAVGVLGRQMAGDGMIQRARHGLVQAGGRSRADEPVENDRYAAYPRMGDRTGHGDKFPPTETAQDLQRVAQCRRVRRDARRHRRRLGREPRVVDARAAPGPVFRRAAVKRVGQCRRRGGVADAHLARHQQVRNARRPPAQPAASASAKPAASIAGPVVKSTVGLSSAIATTSSRAPASSGQLVDRRAARLEIRHHLHRDVGGKRADAAGGHAVISGEHRDLGRGDPRLRVAAPGAIPDREILQPPERARRLGQLRVARLSRAARGVVRGGSARQRASANSVAFPGAERDIRLRSPLPKGSDCGMCSHRPPACHCVRKAHPRMSRDPEAAAVPPSRSAACPSAADAPSRAGGGWRARGGLSLGLAHRGADRGRIGRFSRMAGPACRPDTSDGGGPRARRGHRDDRRAFTRTVWPIARTGSGAATPRSAGSRS